MNKLCGHFAWLTILKVAISCCNSHSETLILGNINQSDCKKVTVYTTLPLSSCRDLSQPLKKNINSLMLILWWKTNWLWFGMVQYLLLYKTICVIKVVKMLWTHTMQLYLRLSSSCLINTLCTSFHNNNNYFYSHRIVMLTSLVKGIPTPLLALHL